jgi:hypothetical protein
MEGSFKEQRFFLMGRVGISKGVEEVLRDWSLETCLGGFKGPLGEFESSLRQHSPQWGGFK